jgi:hypothetical protein
MAALNAPVPSSGLAEATGSSGGGDPAATGRPKRKITSRTVVIHVAVLVAYLAAGIGETWPRVTELAASTLPGNLDAASYQWDFWWVARQVWHLHDPWITGYMAAPAGMPLGYDTTMPLLGVVLSPITRAFSPSVSLNLATIALPGLLCYVMYRLARLWVRSQTAAIAAGALFGFATMIVYQDQVHVNLAAGELLLPVTLEAAVRLRRNPRLRQAVVLGLAIGAAVLVNVESAVLAVMLAACALLPWLLRHPRPRWIGTAGLAGLVAAVAGSPQFIAIANQASSGAATTTPHAIAFWDGRFGVPLQTLFAPSPRLAYFGLHSLAKPYQFVQYAEARPTYGVILSLLAVAGLVIAWRRGAAWKLALLWIGSSAIALGSVLVIGGHSYAPFASVWHGVRVSDVMPYTWFVRIPGLSAFREADRLTLLGLVPACLLAATTVDWLRWHARALLARLLPAALLALTVLEAGWSTTVAAMPATYPALDGPIKADHSGSIVVDIPFGLRSGVSDDGSPISSQALVVATTDAHPRAVSYTSWVSEAAYDVFQSHAFFADLLALQREWRHLPAPLTAARADARALNLGWVLVWRQVPRLGHFLHSTAFSYAYSGDGVAVYRPAPGTRQPANR